MPKFNENKDYTFRELIDEIPKTDNEFNGSFIIKKIEKILANKYVLTSDDLKYVINTLKPDYSQYINRYQDSRNTVIKLFHTYMYSFSTEELKLILRSYIELPYVPEDFTQELFNVWTETCNNPNKYLKLDLNNYTFTVEQLEKSCDNNYLGDHNYRPPVSRDQIAETIIELVKFYKLVPNVKCIDLVQKYRNLKLIQFFSEYGLLPTELYSSNEKNYNYRQVNVSSYLEYKGPLSSKLENKNIQKNNKNEYLFDLLKINNHVSSTYFLSRQFSLYCELSLVTINMYVYFDEYHARIFTIPELENTYISKASLSKLLAYLLSNNDIDFDKYTVFKIPTIDIVDKDKYLELEPEFMKYINTNNLLIKNKIYFDEILTNKYGLPENKYITKTNIKKFLDYVSNKMT